MKSLSDSELASKTTAFRRMLAAGMSMDDLLPEAFAVVREASRRVLSMRHFDVQLVNTQDPLLIHVAYQSMLYSCNTCR